MRVLLAELVRAWRHPWGRLAIVMFGVGLLIFIMRSFLALPLLLLALTPEQRGRRRP